MVDFNFYQGDESEQFTFYRIPKVLFTNSYFKDLSSDAKILYGLMLDRMSLSKKNNWIDDCNRVYIIFTLQEVMDYMNCGKDKGVKLLAELDSKKGIGLIERVKRGLGKPTIIYVKNFMIKDPVKEKEDDFIDDTSCAEGDVNEDHLEGDICGNVTSEKTENRVRKNRSLELGKNRSQSSENQKSGIRKTRSLEFGKTDSNYTDYSNTDKSDTDHIYQSTETSDDTMDTIESSTQLVKKNIEYETLIQDLGNGMKKYIDEILDLIIEVVAIKRKDIRIGETVYPYGFVKNRFLKLRFFHIKYVLSCLDRTTIKINNIRAYLLKCLFNAPSTMEHYVMAEYNHNSC